MNRNSTDNLLVGRIYRSPNSTDENNHQLTQLINEVNSNKYSSLLILGDFNFPHINWELEQPYSTAGNAAVKFLDTVKDNFLFQHVRTPTRSRSYSTPSILDLVLTRDENIIEQMSIEAPLGRSDHSVITFKLYCDKEITTSNVTKYLYDKGDYAKMLQEMNSIDWVQLFGRDLEDDVESQWEFFKNKYLDVVTKHVPTRTSSIGRADKKLQIQ